jgi:hypothetical protein
MTTTRYHVLALAGLLLNIAGSLMVQNSFIQGLGSGITIISYVTILVKNREQNNEATSR